MILVLTFICFPPALALAGHTVQGDPVTDTVPPIGAIDGPASGATVFGSFPVSGWVLDDVAVESVKLYCTGNHAPNNQVYVGDATLVEGARPDIEANYHAYPNRDKAGWGYMMLTQYLPCRNPDVSPGADQGTYTIRATGYDLAGNSFDLGSRTFTIDNTQAIKPFGVIESPAPGGTASGHSYEVTGWVLTPSPNSLDSWGNTIYLMVDGKSMGHASYSQRRADIAALFPDCHNYFGPGASYPLDTTIFSDGVHTIQWSATDNAGNTDGIGSRYFSINNSATQSRVHTQAVTTIDPTSVGVDMTRPLDHEWSRTVNIALELNLATMFSQGAAGETYTYAVYRKVLDTLRPAPVGSSINPRGGEFHWMAGPAFMGDHDLIFTRTSSSGAIEQINIRINYPKPS